MAKMTEAQIRQKKWNRRVRFIGFIMILCMAALLFNIKHIQLTYGADFERYSVMQLIIRQNVHQVIQPAMGGILDRNRQTLADSDRVFNIAIDVNILHTLQPTRNNPNPQERIFERINNYLNIPMETLWGHMAANPDGTLVNPTSWRIIARQIPAYIAIPLVESTPHVHLEEQPLRRFPDPYLAPQVLGFVRGDAAWGLENQYRAELTGTPGRIMRSFQADGSTILDEPAQDGYWLVTTLDSGIQRIAQRHVENAAVRYQARFTGIIIMNPQTGEILAMAQWPSFSLAAPDDGALFTDPSIANSWAYMDSDEQLASMFRIWPNFAINQSFEPGSTFKPFVIAAAVEEGIISPNMSRFYCAGVRTVADWDIGCHNRNGHGSLNVIEALMVSCNIAPMDIIQSMGRDIFYRYRNDFGFGDITGIDLPGEASVSGPGVMYTLSQLNPVELATSAIGQGFNATPIQKINAFASLINGGYVMQPYVVSQIIDSQGQVVSETNPTVVRNVLSQQTSDFMREAMQNVVSPSGTGRRVGIDGYTIGGKTGTGEQGNRRAGWVVTSFLGYMPVENPQFLAIGVVYNPEDNQLTAGASAAPMIRDVFEDIINYRQLPPAGSEQATGVIMDIGGEIMPDFSGMELREVTSILNGMGIDFQISGRGAVLSRHIPVFGQPVPRGNPVFLYLDGNIDNLDDLTFMPYVEGLSDERAMELVTEAGLVPVIVTERPMGRSLWDPYPEEENEAEETEQAEQFIIYRQFPSAGLHIQRGSHVRLRARAAD